MAKKEILGIVIRKHLSTLAVQVEREVRHAKYQKTLRFHKVFLVDNLNNEAEIGNMIKAVEVSPISKKKHFKLIKVYK